MFWQWQAFDPEYRLEKLKWSPTYFQGINMKPPPGSDQHSENQNILENHFSLQETFRRTMNGSSQWKFVNLSPKLVVKMNLYNSFTTRINIPNQFKKEEELWNWRHSIPIGVWHFNKEKLLSITKLIMSDFHKVTSSRKRNTKSHTSWQSNIRIREVEWSW